MALLTSNYASGAVLGGSKGPKRSPRDPKMGPRRPQDGPGSRQERPRSAPRGPKSRTNSAFEPSWRPNGSHVAPKSPPEGHFGPQESHFGPPRDAFSPSGRQISQNVYPPGKIFEAALSTKLGQAYGQHRSTSLCNFYMWISTATDSRSRSTNPCMDR